MRASLFGLSVVSVLALSASACGGRLIDVGGDDPDGAPTDSAFDGGDPDGGTLTDGARPLDSSEFPPDDDGPPPFDDGPPPFDDGPIEDTSVIFDDGPPVDVGPPPMDAIVTDAIMTDGGPPLATVCDDFAAATCTPAFKSCCSSKGLGYDSIGCNNVAEYYCDSSRDNVTASKAVYNPSYATACAAAWKAATTSCTLSLTDWIKNRVPCSATFNGKTAAGGSCVIDSDCHSDAGAVGICDESSKKCRQYAVVGKGVACSYFGVSPKICDHNLYCDYSSTGAAVCKDAKALGAGCFGVDDQSCGLGYSCKAGKCAVGSPVGAMCTRDLDCASWSCSVGKCTDPNVTLAGKALCTGT